MIHILLLILKIIGILLLSLLGLLLLIVLCILFAPVRYYGKCKYDTSHKEIHFKIKYLLGLFRFKIDVSGKNYKYSFKVLVFELLNKDKNKVKRKQKKNLKKNQEKTTQTDSVAIAKEEVQTDTEINIDAENQSKVNIATENQGKSDINAENEKQNDNDNSIQGDNQRSFPKSETVFKRFYYNLKSSILKIIDFFTNFKFKIKDFCDKLSEINTKKKEYMDFLSATESKEAIKTIKELLLKTGKHIAPQKITGSLRFGTGESSTTGQLLGLISIFGSKYLKKLKLCPDFENQIIEADVRLKGRLRVFNLLIIAIKLYKIKRLREFISFVKK